MDNIENDQVNFIWKNQILFEWIRACSLAGLWAGHAATSLLPLRGSGLLGAEKEESDLPTFHTANIREYLLYCQTSKLILALLVTVVCILM